MADNLPEPKSRKEQYLATAAGATGIELPEPASREEIYLNAIAEGGGGGGGGYVLPVASASTLGGVKVGNNLTIDESGALSAQGGQIAKYFSSDMYNYPADNPDGVALWLLDPGLYAFAYGDNDTKIYITTDWNGKQNVFNSLSTFLVGGKARSDYKKVIGFNPWPSTDTSTGAQDAITIFDLSKFGYLRNGRHDVLTTDDTQDNLTSTQTHIPLSANQGRILNGKIEALTGIRTLTSEDFNYPTNNPDGVALWSLPAGIYQLKGIKFYLTTNRYDYDGSPMTIIINPHEAEGDVVLFSFGGQYTGMQVTNDLGADAGFYAFTMQ